MLTSNNNFLQGDELTALHIASGRGNLEMVQTLIQLGAQIKRLKMIFQSNSTPMDCAEQKGQTEVLEYLNSLRKHMLLQWNKCIFCDRSQLKL